jgi:pilus assembly protein FimV
MDFDLGSLSLDLDTPPAEKPGEAAEPQDSDPLATKLALAEEFRAIGDTDGARSLAQEVRDEASGELRERAERLLADLG